MALRRLLAAGADVNCTIHGYTPLLLSLVRGELEAARCLLEAGADVSRPEQGRQQRQPLHHAACLGDVALLTGLLRRGASVHATDAALLSPLHCAASAGHLTTTELLIDAGAHLNVRDRRGCTPLFRAALCGHIDIVDCLVEQGATLNKTTCDGWTALSMCVVAGRLPMVKCLLSHGASVEVRNRLQQTVVQTAVARLAPYNRNALAAAGETERCRWQSDAVTSPAILRELLDAGADVNVTDAHQTSPFQITVEDGDTRLACMLVAAGTNLQRDGVSLLRLLDIIHPRDARHHWLALRAQEGVAALQETCKHVIRRSLKPGITAKIAHLPLPNDLKDFLQLHDITTDLSQKM